MDIFDINNILWEPFGYKLSYAEAIGASLGLIAVYLAGKQKLLTWPLGIISIVFSFAIFYQVQLYSDMFLHIYFFGMNIYGWYNWRNQNKKKQSVQVLSNSNRIKIGVAILGTAIAWGFLMLNIHLWLPKLFPKPAAFPFFDAYVFAASLFAQWLMARRNIEHWFVWISVDVLAVCIYFIKDIKFISLEYGIFLLISFFGIIEWRKELKAESSSRA